MLHPFLNSITPTTLPERFTYPFHYTPHPLCILAAEEVQHYLCSRGDWKEELAQGKMFGVLVVQTEKGDLGYLAAFSGILAGKNQHSFFVPPIYDLLQPQGFFKIEEENISNINSRIEQLENDPDYKELLSDIAIVTQSAQDELKNSKERLKAEKVKRELLRQQPITSEKEAELIRESQFQKAEHKRLEHFWKEKTVALQVQANCYIQQIAQLKAERKSRSGALQQQLFEQFKILNDCEEIKTLCDIFEQTIQKIPPAGAGECAAPKLLQYAYLQGWKPIAMAEFWWGASPKTEIRHHGHYYPACKGKCEPILKHMLQGLKVDDNPLSSNCHAGEELEVIFEDDYLVVVNKPAGMLSVPGKDEINSVYHQMRQRYPEADGPMIVHRLDMATSGLMVITKTKKVHQHMQAQFKNHTIKKKYIALLDGTLSQQEGIVELPLCMNLFDRPRQMVHLESGKPAVTRYQVLEQTDKYTRVALFPYTGRTHQLRVHSAHPSGLNCPIIGDELYGKKAERLYLHAETLEFIHPVTEKKICLHKKADF